MDTQLNNLKTSLIPWLSIDEDKNIRAKVLSLNPSTKNVELLFKIKAGYRSGPHRHTCETKIYVVSGEVFNHNLKESFRQGDYCFQPKNDIHDEEFLEDSIIYVNYISETDTFVEFLDENLKVLDTLTMEQFKKMMDAQSARDLPNPPPPGV